MSSREHGMIRPARSLFLPLVPVNKKRRSKRRLFGVYGQRRLDKVL
jgi:hypothetical protein